MKRPLFFVFWFILAIYGVNAYLATEIFPSSFTIDRGGIGYGNISITNKAPFSIDNLFIIVNLSSIDGLRISNISFYESPFSLGIGEKKNIGFYINTGGGVEGDYFGIFAFSNGSFYEQHDSLTVRVRSAGAPTIISYSPREVQHGSSVLFSVKTHKKAICRYSYAYKDYGLMQDFDVSYETLHVKTLQDLSDGLYHVYVVCKDDDGVFGSVYDANFSVSRLPSAQIILNNSILRAGLNKVSVITSKKVFQTPSLSYSFDGSSFTQVPLSGEGNMWSGYLYISQAGNAVGSFSFSAKDLDGNVGNEITRGNVFVVDTVKPSLINNIQAIGYAGDIALRWYYNEEADHFNIYRDTSPGVDYTDFYMSTEYKSESDSGVAKGATYYYRVSAVDAAGNEGDLSKEVYATVLLANSTMKSKLSQELLGKVDRVLSNIEKVANDATFISENFQIKEKDIFSILEFAQKISSAKNELDVLKRELESYKDQDLTEVELDKKLNAAQLKINLIKKNIPEQIIVEDEKNFDSAILIEDLERIISEVNPGLDESTLRKNIENNKDIVGDKVHIFAKVIKVVYLDGSEKEMTLIEKQARAGNYSYIEYIPKAVVEGMDSIEVKSKGYEVLKDDPVIKFSGENIAYSIINKVDLSLIEGTRLVPILEIQKGEDNGYIDTITGYFVYAKNGGSWFIALVVAACLIAFLFIIRMRKSLKGEEALINLERKLDAAERALSEGRHYFVKGIYQEITGSYKLMKRRQKKTVHKRISEIYSAYRVTERLNSVNSLISQGRLSEAKKIFEGIEPAYKKLPVSLKSQYLEDYEKARSLLG